MLFLDAISELQNIKYSHRKSRYYGNRKTRSGNMEFVNDLEEHQLLFQRILLRFHWICMLFLNAISELQNIKYSNWKSRYYGSRKTRSANVCFLNVLEVSNLLFQRILLSFHWIFMLFLDAISELQNVKYSNWNT